MSRTMPLEVIRVDEPCKADWDAMTGDAARRFCAGCQKHVHNLSAMPREEAERLVCESAGRLWLVELNSFSGSWLYACNLRAVVSAASELAEQAWQRRRT